MFKLFFILAFLPSVAFSNWDSVESAYSMKRSSSRYRSLVISLVDNGYYFSAIPWMKEYIIQTSKPLDDELEERFDLLLTHTGVKPFETMSVEHLKNSRSPSIRYIIGKKYLKQNMAEEAGRWLREINGSHHVYPFAANLLGSVYSVQGKSSDAISTFENCVSASKSELGRTSDTILKRQLIVNMDYCILGIARTHFSKKQFKEAELKYLDISKNSPIWPEILFEEAWTSYYQGNYNRTLGKLVTYNAPVLDYYFNPEVNVLNALSYMKLCLYEDAKKVADNFYSKYLVDTKGLKKHLVSKGKDYRYFYRTMATFEEGTGNQNPFMDKILGNIAKDGAYLEIRKGVVGALAESQRLQSNGGRLSSSLRNNLIAVTNTQKNLLGGYVRSRMIKHYGSLVKAFQGMSYIKLDILDQKKQRLYSNEVKGRTRGDVKYLDRNEKQYFWTFNGEFWSDELGDYVFALGSEC